VAAHDQPSDPTIITPVSRLLGSTDLGRTAAFYRDVLGFQVRRPDGEPRLVDVILGKARLRFGASDDGPGDRHGARRPGPAVVFFETNDVARLHAVIRGRGGSASEPENVNAIKMRVFEIRDPDGHTLWFGQSFAAPAESPALGLLERIMPELPLTDVSGGIAHYRDILGFRVNYQQADLGVMDRDDVRLLLVARSARHQGIGSAYVYVRDADALHAELAGKGANVQGAPVSQPWGLREFRVLDLEDNQLTFAQPFE
jgi:predicted enzyme related to lactoylglutathione lyase